MTAKSDASDREIVIVREFAAPRPLVWDVWTRPEHIARWWGPRGFTTTVTAMDLQPGGKWRYVMHGPDGSDYPVHGVFLEVVPPERIVTTDEFDDGWTPPQPIDLPKGIVATAVFAEAGPKTRLTLTMLWPRRRRSTRRWAWSAGGTPASTAWTTTSRRWGRTVEAVTRIPAQRGRSGMILRE